MFIDKVITTAWFLEPPKMQTAWKSAVRLVAIPSEVIGTRTVMKGLSALLPIKPLPSNNASGYRLIRDRREYNGSKSFKPLPDPLTVFNGLLTYSSISTEPNDLEEVFRAMTDFESTQSNVGKPIWDLYDEPLPSGFVVLEGHHYKQDSAYHVFHRNECKL